MLKKRFLILATVLTMALFCCPFVTSANVQAADSVTMSLEKFTLGQGYIIEPLKVEITEGDTVATVLGRVLADKKIDYGMTGNLQAGFYMQDLTDPDPNREYIDLPTYIYDFMNKPGTTSTAYPRQANDNKLGEFDYYTTSGWIYAVNNVTPNVGASEYPVKDGDVIRWQFTLVGYGADLGADNSSWGGGASSSLINAADKDDLTVAMADAVAAGKTTSNAYKNAVAAMRDMNATQDRVNTALSNLVNDSEVELDTTPLALTRVYFANSITLNETYLDLDVGETAQLTAAVAPANADIITYRSIKWRSRTRAVATVDSDGTVTALSPGTAEIVSYDSGDNIRAIATVIVRGEDSVAVTGVSLNKSTLSLPQGYSEKLLTVFAPAHASIKNVAWSSDNAAVATVSETGTVTTVAPGTATITVTTVDGSKTAACTLTVTATVNPTANLADVVETNWFYGDVSAILATGIMKGDSTTTFSPNSNISRRDFVTILGRWAGITDSTAASPATTPFTDVDGTKYFASHVKWAAENGITTGTTTTTFAPNALITRQDLATMVVRYAKAMNIDLPEPGNATFPDDSQIKDYAKDPVYSLKAAGILSGKDTGNFDPTANATRAEAAKIIHMLMEL